MILKKYFTLLFFLVFYVPICWAQETILYKQIDTTKLFVDVYYPEKKDLSITHPTIIFFFGGGLFVLREDGICENPFKNENYNFLKIR
jgi:acetyl esterase/lipase